MTYRRYKYLGITEIRVSRNTQDMFEKLLKFTEVGFEALCRYNLNAKNLIRAINEYASFQINYYLGRVEILSLPIQGSGYFYTLYFYKTSRTPTIIVQGEVIFSVKLT